jgi:hypothetical protein
MQPERIPKRQVNLSFKFMIKFDPSFIFFTLKIEETIVTESLICQNRTYMVEPDDGDKEKSDDFEENDDEKDEPKSSKAASIPKIDQNNNEK